MNEGLEGLLLLLGVTVVAALASHALIGKYLVASLVAAFLSVVAFQALSYAHLGYVDPFLPVAVVLSAAICFVLSLAIGLPFRRKRLGQTRRTRREKRP